jgi:hypothetical protein
MTVEEEITVTDEEIQLSLGTIDFSDLEKKYAVEKHDPLENVIIIDGTPAVDVAKKEKLLVVLKKKCKENGCAELKEVYFPEEGGKLKGYASF